MSCYPSYLTLTLTLTLTLKNRHHSQWACVKGVNGLVDVQLLVVELSHDSLGWLEWYGEEDYD